MSRDRMAKLKTEVLEQAEFILKAQQTTLFMQKIEYFTCIQREFDLFYIPNR